MKVHITIEGTLQNLPHLIALGLVRPSQLVDAGADHELLDHAVSQGCCLIKGKSPEEFWGEFAGILVSAPVTVAAASPAAPPTPTPEIQPAKSCYVTAPRVAPIDWHLLGEREVFDTWTSFACMPRWAHWEALHAEERHRIAGIVKAFLGREWDRDTRGIATAAVHSIPDPDRQSEFVQRCELYVPQDIRDKARVTAGSVGKLPDPDAMSCYAVMLSEFFINMGMPANPFKPIKAPRAQKARA